MDVITLDKGIKLDRKINQCTSVLDCFEWKSEEGTATGVSRNPRLIIEYDDADGREEQEVPFELNPEIIAAIKWWVIQKRDQAVEQFNNL